MTYQVNFLGRMQENANIQMRTASLEEKITSLIEWKRKALVQLEYFRLACSLYNLCDVKDINELLKT